MLKYRLKVIIKDKNILRAILKDYFLLTLERLLKIKYIENIYVFEANAKYISSSAVKYISIFTMPQGRATQKSRDTRKTNQAKQPALSCPSRWL